jgi:Entner-Doudoroff aldolase
VTAHDDFFTRHLADVPVMVILRGFGAQETVRLCDRARQCGVGLVEVPVQSRVDRASFDAALAWGAESGVPVGAGTVTSALLHRQVVDAGAAFTVAPGLDEDVAAAARSSGVPHLPGVATATEVQRAASAGFGWLKAFPASSLGPAWFAAMRGPFPGVRLVATGGVRATTGGAFLHSGADAVALGSSFADASPEEVRALGGDR